MTMMKMKKTKSNEDASSPHETEWRSRAKKEESKNGSCPEFKQVWISSLLLWSGHQRISIRLAVEHHPERESPNEMLVPVSVSSYSSVYLIKGVQRRSQWEDKNSTSGDNTKCIKFPFLSLRLRSARLKNITSLASSWWKRRKIKRENTISRMRRRREKRDSGSNCYTRVSVGEKTGITNFGESGVGG